MNYTEAVEYFHSLERFGSKLGLERIKKLLEMLGNPQDKLKFIHVAGTNGKGSTVAMCARILEKSGYKTGMYTSPFVVDFRERFRINSEMIPKEDLADVTAQVKAKIELMNAKGEEVTEFEAVTAAAFLYFAQMSCDIVCLEVGLGGRFDATNVIKTPLAAVITPISMDHMNVLGDTIEKIAAEKAGIIKYKSDVVTSPGQDPDALGVIMEKCFEQGGRLYIPSIGSVKILDKGIGYTKFSYGDKVYTVSLSGRHQVDNALTALEVMNLLRQKGFNIPEKAQTEALAEISFPARFEIVGENPLIIIDGAHNIAGADALANTIKDLKISGITAVMAMMADKDYESSVGKIAPLCDRIIAVKASNPRSLEPEKLAETARRYCGEVLVCEDLSKALAIAKDFAGKDNTILICGSLYLAGDIEKIIKMDK